MPALRLPFPDPAIPLAQAIANIAGCYDDNAAVRALTAAATCKGADQTDLQALLSLVIAAALCAARNPDENCCEVDPFVVNNLQVADSWTTLNLDVTGEGLIMGDVTVSGTLCMPRTFAAVPLGTSLILAQNNVGCLKYFPKSDLDHINLHLPGNLIVEAWTQLLTLQQDGDATFGGGWNLLGDLNALAGICVGGLPETEWTDDAHLLFVKEQCFNQTPAGQCCNSIPDCCPPFTFDPDAIGYPDPEIFPQLNPPPGANTTCERPLYSADDNPSPPDPYSIFCSQMITEGALIDSGYNPGITFGMILDRPCPTLLGTLYYNNATASWQQAEPTFGTDGSVTYYTVMWYSIGYVVLFGDTDPGHEYLKPSYDGLTFDEHHLCPGDS